MKYYSVFQCEFHPFVHVSATPNAIIPLVESQKTSIAHIYNKGNTEDNTDTETDDDDDDDDGIMDDGNKSDTKKTFNTSKKRRGGVSLPPPPPLPTASRSDSRGRVPWIVGFVDPLHQSSPLERYPGDDHNGFGFSFLGTIHHNSQTYRYCVPSILQKTKTFSILIDLHIGQLSLIADGKNLGVAFGPDSICIPKIYCSAHGSKIRSGKMISTFALGRHCLTKMQTSQLFVNKNNNIKNSIDNSGSNSRESTPLQNKIKSSMDNYNNDNDNDDNSSSSSSSINSSSSSSNINNSSSNTNNNNSSKNNKNNSFKNRNGRRKTILTGNTNSIIGLEEILAKNQIQKITIYNLPAISVNFGAYTFHHPIKGVSGFDSYLSFSEPTDVSDMHNKNQMERENGRNNENIEMNHLLKPKKIASDCIRSIKDKVKFYKKWEPESVHSWSDYSPTPGVSHTVSFCFTCFFSNISF
jgi:hypothetical protein